jgi:hypothetical protein
MSALLNRKPVLWFLFLFNAAGMGIVSLGAGVALFLRRPKRA